MSRKGVRSLDGRGARGHLLSGPLGLGGHGVCDGLVAMATLDRSSSKAPAHLISTLVGTYGHRYRDEGGYVIAKEEK